MRMIIINGLKLKYSGFMAVIRGWPTQPTLLELENMFANQEALAIYLVDVSLKHKEEALFNNRSQGRLNPKQKPTTEDEPNQQQRLNEKINNSGEAYNQRSGNS